VLLSALTVTSSHSFLIAPSFQVISTRSLPPAPPPARTLNDEGAGAEAQAEGVFQIAELNVLPVTRSVRSLAVIEPCAALALPVKSNITPLMPLVKPDRLAPLAATVALPRYGVFRGSMAVLSRLAIELMPTVLLL
jgi:hypothetical protein